MIDLTRCECSVPGRCSRYQRPMHGRYWDICRGASGLGFEKEQQYREHWAQQAGIVKAPEEKVTSTQHEKTACNAWAGETVRVDGRAKRRQCD